MWAKNPVGWNGLSIHIRLWADCDEVPIYVSNKMSIKSLSTNKETWKPSSDRDKYAQYTYSREKQNIHLIIGLTQWTLHLKRSSQIDSAKNSVSLHPCSFLSMMTGSFHCWSGSSFESRMPRYRFNWTSETLWEIESVFTQKDVSTIRYGAQTAEKQCVANHCLLLAVHFLWLILTNSHATIWELEVKK